jgi:hypothetical protein
MSGAQCQRRRNILGRPPPDLRTRSPPVRRRSAPQPPRRPESHPSPVSPEARRAGRRWRSKRSYVFAQPVSQGARTRRVSSRPWWTVHGPSPGVCLLRRSVGLMIDQVTLCCTGLRDGDASSLQRVTLSALALSLILARMNVRRGHSAGLSARWLRDNRP